MKFEESWTDELKRAEADRAKRDADPFLAKADALIRGMEAISTHALLDLIGLPKTTGNGRRIARTMRSLGFIPIKSRRLEPGGWTRHRYARMGEARSGVTVSNEL